METEVSNGLINIFTRIEACRYNFKCEIRSKFTQYHYVQTNSDTHSYATEPKKKRQASKGVRGPGRMSGTKKGMFFVCEVGSKFMQYYYKQRSDSDVHVDVTEPKQGATGTGHASATKKKGICSLLDQSSYSIVIVMYRLWIRLRHIL